MKKNDWPLAEIRRELLLKKMQEKRELFVERLRKEFQESVTEIKTRTDKDHDFDSGTSVED